MHPMVKTSLFSFIAILLIFSPLQAVGDNQQYFSGTTTRDGISVSVKELSQQDAKRRLGNKFAWGKRKRPYSLIPLSVSVTNNTDRLIEFSKEDIGLKLVSAKELKRSLASRLEAISFFLGTGLIFFMYFSVPILIGMALCSANIFMIIGLYVFATILLPDLFVCCRIWQSSKNRTSAYWKVLAPYKEGYQYVGPDEAEETIIYVRKKDLKKSFNVSVGDVPRNQTINLNIEGAYSRIVQ